MSALPEVLVIAPWARRLGGAEEMLWEFSRTHPRDRLALSIVFLEAGHLQRDIAALGVPTAVIGAGRLRSPFALTRTVARLARLITRRRPTVVLNWMAKAQLYGAPAVVLSGAHPRVIWWQHLVPAGHWMDRLATALPATAVGASSRASADAQRLLWPGRRTFNVHPGIDLPEDSAVGPSRSQLGLSGSATLVTIVGRLQPWKGQQRAIDAIAQLRDHGLDVQLLIVGGAAFGFDEDYEPALRAQVSRLGLGEHVRMVGQVDSAHPYLRISDIALNASESEPFGIVLLEALANGVAVVAVDAAGPAEIVVDGVTGVLTRDGSPGALAAAMGALVTDPDRRRAIAERGRCRHGREFTAQVMSDRIADELLTEAR